MSRRPVGPDKSEQNRATLKQLVKLESNKSCADCKRNKHPRWASWNIGVFVCIRCSGVHRSLGVHISRVKSVDLDSWTDEQMASMIKWGNGRANKYWEHKLADGHAPNEAKIENFIRTKYESRRWVMDGPIPDPSTLDDGVADDDVPLNVVKANIERSGSLRNGTAANGPAKPRQPQIDLFGDVQQSAPARPSTTEPAQGRGFQGPPKAAAAPPKQSRPGESLLGLDFFGGAQSAPPRPASATSGATTPGAPGRTDLKNSILSLYASAPRTAAPPAQPQQPQQQAHSNVDLFGGMSSGPLASPTQASSSQSMGGVTDSFSSLSFSQPQAQSSPFSNLSSPTTHGRQRSSLSGGSFFDVKPAPPPKQSAPPLSTRKASNGFGELGDFSSGPSPVMTNKPTPQLPASSDLFSVSSQPSPPAPTTAAAPKSQLAFPTAAAFNLSNPKPAPAIQTTTFSSATTSANPWGVADNAWTTPDPAPAPAPPRKPLAPTPSTYKAPAAAPSLSSFDAGWGDDVDSPAAAAQPIPLMDPLPKPTSAAGGGGGFSVQQDEEFGGWSHASPVAAAPAAGGKGSGGGSGGGQDDLFGNVWG